MALKHLFSVSVSVSVSVRVSVRVRVRVRVGYVASSALIMPQVHSKRMIPPYTKRTGDDLM